MRILLLIFLLLPFCLPCDDYEYTCDFDASEDIAKCRFSCPPGADCNCTCPSGSFRCGTAKIPPKPFQSITSALMSETFYQMHTSECIPESKRDDGYYDCPGQEDETDLPLWKLNRTVCEDAFQCVSFFTVSCLSKNFVCDGKIDCPNQSDEENCENKYKNVSQTSSVESYFSHEVYCNEYEFNCGKFCIPLIWKSDGQVDCPNKKDEENIVGEPFKCPLGFYRCPMEPKCLEKSRICDGISDCLGASDEINCKFTCPEGQFRCNNGQCINQYLRCDGTMDCKDGTDEHNCKNMTYRNDRTFICRKADIHISSAFLCDGTPDCPDNSDENNCIISPNCDRNHFECKRNKICIPSIWRCDGDKDCPDGSDEDYCNMDTSIKSLFNFTKCQKNLKLCQDGSCKEFCPTKCEADSYTCPDGECINFSEICSTSDCKNRDICGSKNTIYGCDITKDQNCQKKLLDSGVTVYHCKKGFSNFWNRGCEPDNEVISGSYCNVACKPVLYFSGFNILENCKCYPGFSKVYGTTLDTVDGSRFRVNSGERAELLLMSPDQILKYNFYKKKLDRIGEVLEDHIAGSVYYLKNQTFIWNSLKTKKIMKCYFPLEKLRTYKSFENPSFDEMCKNKTAVVSNTISYYMALDWIHGLLYYVDEGNLSITVVNFLKQNARPKILLQGSFQHFRGLQIDPSIGVLFFIASGKIHRASLDGSNVTTIINDFHRPTSLFLDFYEKKVYFSDTKQGRIFSMNYLGKNMKKHFTSRESIHPIYSIAVFEDTLYFNDEKGVYAVSPKKNKYPQKISRGFGYPMVFQIVHETFQPEFIDKCKNNKCGDFCFPINLLEKNTYHNRSYACGCRDWFRISNETLCVPVQKKEERKIHVATTTVNYIVSTELFKSERENVEHIAFLIYCGGIVLITISATLCIICQLSNRTKEVTSESPVSFNELRVREEVEENRIFNTTTSKIPALSFGNPSYNDVVKSEP